MLHTLKIRVTETISYETEVTVDVPDPGDAELVIDAVNALVATPELDRTLNLAEYQLHERTWYYIGSLTAPGQGG